MKVVLDTNVLVAALRSNAGASFALLEQVGPGAPFQLALSVPLVLEYESILRRRTELGPDDIEQVVDYLCSVGDLREIHFLWRPFLKDPADEMVLELAVEASADVIVTHNVRDFKGVEEAFGVRILKPRQLLAELRGDSG